MLALFATLPLALLAPSFVGEAAPCDSFASPPPAQDPAFIADGIFLASPSAGAVVPRNVVLMLTGTLFLLDGPEPTFEISLLDETGALVAVERQGQELRPAALLDADREYTFVSGPSEHHGCPECVIAEQSTFRTSAEIDLVGPEPIAPEGIDLSLGLEGCVPETGILRVDLPLLDDVVLLQVALALERALPREIAAIHPLDFEPRPHLLFGLGADTVFVDDEAVVAFTGTDVAGNLSIPHLLRVRAWDALPTMEQPKPAPNLTCVLPATPVVEAPALLPRNGQIVVRFPFEAFALSLETEGGERIGLYEEDQAGPLLQVFRPLDPPPSGETLRLVAEPCAACACPGCVLAPESTLQWTDVDDERPPPAPLLRDVRFTPSPPSQMGGECRLDRAHVEARLASDPGDAIAYHAALKRPGEPRRVLDRYVPAIDDDGERVVRFSARGLEDLFVGPWVLEVTAVDAAGHTSTAAFVTPDGAPTGGCGGNHAVAPGAPGLLSGLGALLALTLAGGGRRRPRPVGSADRRLKPREA